MDLCIFEGEFSLWEPGLPLNSQIRLLRKIKKNPSQVPPTRVREKEIISAFRL